MAENTPQPNPLPERPTTPLAPATPDLDPSPFSSPEPKYEEPLYTEINIPLPPPPKSNATSPRPSTSASSKSRPRAHTLHSPFHRRGSSSSSAGKDSEEWPRIRKEVKNKDVAAMMNLGHRNKRSGTIDALAVVPTVLVLSAELFTPSGGEKKNKGLGRWEDSIR